VDSLKQCVGEFTLRWPEDTCTVELWSFETYLRFRGQGYGAAMLSLALEKAEYDAPDGEYDRIMLYVKQSNTTAIDLYERHGFKALQYNNTSLDITMEREL
jgi:ribosomal protein S18 acetylase RimI-like enzyme